MRQRSTIPSPRHRALPARRGRHPASETETQPPRPVYLSALPTRGLAIYQPTSDVEQVVNYMNHGAADGAGCALAATASLTTAQAPRLPQSSKLPYLPLHSSEPILGFIFRSGAVREEP